MPGTRRENEGDSEQDAGDRRMPPIGSRQTESSADDQTDGGNRGSIPHAATVARDVSGSDTNARTHEIHQDERLSWFRDFVADRMYAVIALRYTFSAGIPA